MKIVDRKTFLGLPAGTLFSKYAPHYFEEASIKGGTFGDGKTANFFSTLVSDAVKCKGLADFVNLLDCAANSGASIDLDLDRMGRDTCFDDDQLFAVWEKKDVDGLISVLLRADS